MPNLITIDLDALPGVLTESLRRVLTAHGYTLQVKTGSGTTGCRAVSDDEAEATFVEVGRNGAQAVAAATQLRSTDDEADALAELQEFLANIEGCGETQAENLLRWGDALRALRGG